VQAERLELVQSRLKLDHSSAPRRACHRAGNITRGSDGNRVRINHAWAGVAMDWSQLGAGGLPDIFFRRVPLKAVAR
jgi:hypothetical protein